MKKIIASQEILLLISEKINNGLTNDILGYSADTYCEVLVDENTNDSFIIIDENDERNPMQYLSESEKSLATNFFSEE